ncbi:hypothetical protein BLA29_014194 [Euroglyphus maynei]|uniref:Uncharacterized protein n=1 Tax=Euroglyphus maynei TaxID=6958 RepID=A0A1Y3B340_EURMA|nr:hypothetical protein BLA29_014194 [Euroglyphus maynei]
MYNILSGYGDDNAARIRSDRMFYKDKQNIVAKNPNEMIAYEIEERIDS